MTNRRQFLKQSGAALAGLSIAPHVSAGTGFQPGLSGSCHSQILLDIGCKPYMTSALKPVLAAGKLPLSFEGFLGSHMIDDTRIQTITRYQVAGHTKTLSPGLRKSVTRLPSKVGSSFAVLDEAVQTQVLPFGLIVNTQKAFKGGRFKPSLANFKKRAIKPVLGVYPSDSAPGNSWMVPYFKSLGALEPDFWQESKAEADYAGFHQEIADIFNSVRLSDGTLIDGETIYSALIDPKKTEVSAIYGDYAELVKILDQQDGLKGFHKQYELYPVQTLLGTSQPSYFAAEYLQVGQSVPDEEADWAVWTLAKVFAEVDGVPAVTSEGFGDLETKAFQLATSQVMGHHNPAYYGANNQGGYMLDQKWLPDFMIDLRAGLSQSEMETEVFATEHIYKAILAARQRRQVFLSNIEAGCLCT